MVLSDRNFTSGHQMVPLCHIIFIFFHASKGILVDLSHSCDIKLSIGSSMQQIRITVL